MIVKSLFLVATLIALWIPVTAQPSDDAASSPVIGADMENGITFYRTDASAQLTRIGGLSTEFVLSEELTADHWNIPAVESMAASPDGQKIAFAARRQDNDTALFIYSPASDELQQIEVEHTFFPNWSPDSQAIFLWNHEGYALYDLQTEALQPIEVNSAVGIRALWLPDSTTLAYGAVDGIHLIDRTTLTQTHLVDTTPGTSDTGESLVCHLKWSPLDQRLYYGIACAMPGFAPPEMLYSVDLSSSVRQETAALLYEVFSDRFLSQYHDIYALSEPEGLYAFVTSNFGLDAAIGYWNILQLVDGQWNKIFEAELDNAPLADVELSPDETKMAVTSQNWNGNGVNTRFVTVVDLLTGTEIVERNHTTDYICRTTWQDDQTLLYTVYSEGYYCKPDLQPSVMDVYSFNIVTGKVVNLTEDIAGSAWILQNAFQ